MAFKEYLKNLVTRRPDAAEIALGAEGMVYLGGFDYGNQTVKMRADKQAEYKPGQTAAMSAVGGVAGPVIGRAVEATGAGIAKGIEKATNLVKPEEKALKSMAPILDITETKNNGGK